MRILLDENLLSKKLKHPLVAAGQTVQNVEDMGWRGTKDSALLALANQYPFDVFVTADKNLPFQQNVQSLTLRVVVLNVSSTRPTHLLPLIAQIIPLLPSLAPGSITLLMMQATYHLLTQTLVDPMSSLSWGG
jgi:predicted nuclease of predicted toxin-antitoxin system